MEGVIKKDSNKKGKVLSVFCGVHGNESAGIHAVQKVLKDIKIQKGIVYFVFANPKAIEENKRFIDKDLNRCFGTNQENNSYEEKRANELKQLLNSSDALLDVHASNSPDSTPFIITDNGLDIAKYMDFKIIATGFDDIEPGATDGFMRKQNNEGICLECGYIGNSKENIDLAYNSILQFLQYYNAIENKIHNNSIDQKILHVDKAQKVTNETFELTRNFADFETLDKGFVIAKDEHKQYVTNKERVILFGSQNKPIGAEAYILGNWIKG